MTNQYHHGVKKILGTPAMHYGVALDFSQAEAILRHRPAAEAIVSFCPAAGRRLEENGYRVIPAVAHYRALSHAKTAVLIARDLAAMKPRLKDFYRLSDGEAQNLSVYLFHFLSIAYYIYFATRFLNRTGDQCFWVGGNGAIRHGDYLAMYLDTVAQGKSRILVYSNQDFSYLHYCLMSAFNRIVAGILRLRKKKKIIDFGDELPKKMINPILGISDEFAVIASKKVSKNIYKSCYFFVKSCARAMATPAKDKPVWVFRAASPGQYKMRALAPDISLAYHEVTLATRAAIQAYVPFLKAEYAIGKKLVNLLKPDIAISDFAKYPYVLAAQESLRAYGGMVVMMNHGSHTAQHDPISKIAATLWAAQDRVITPFVTDHAPKSPLTAEITKEIRADNAYRVHKISPFQRIVKHPSPQDEFMILHAGNFTDVYTHIAWCKETAEEYLLAIYELLDAMQDIEGAKLIIKLKPKKAGAHVALVQAAIDKRRLNGKVVIDTATKFAELLAKTSLIVSNLSGTVEEALVNHIPVMIHTYHKKYFHIPEHMLSGDGLNPAYQVREKKDIKTIIEFAQKNRDSLFNTESYRKVAWQENETTSLDDFAREIISLSKQKSL